MIVLSVIPKQSITYALTVIYHERVHAICKLGSIMGLCRWYMASEPSHHDEVHNEMWAEMSNTTRIKTYILITYSAAYCVLASYNACITYEKSAFTPDNAIVLYLVS